MKTGSGFLDRLIERMDRLDPSSIQAYVLRLAREKGFLETVFNTIREGVIVVDRELRIRYINIAAQRLLGIQESATNHRIDRYLPHLDWASLLGADVEHWRRLSRQEIEVFYPEHRYLSFYLVPVHDDSDGAGMPLATLILHDVTQARQDTEKTIESQKVQAITMLAAGVAHELGNPLNSLNIHLQLLSRTLRRIKDEELAGEVRELAEVAAHEVERLDAIVQNFLRAVRPVPPDMRQVTIQKVLTETLAFMRTEIENREIRVDASLPQDLPRVMADRDQLKQAFYNIIKNAVQAMPDGGLLEIVCTVDGDFVSIRFADTGKGISPDDFSRITDPYFTTRPDGTGLGLLIVDRIVRSHGGEMGIETGEHGAAFTIRLPLRERQIRMLEAARPVAAIGPGDETSGQALSADNAGLASPEEGM